MSNNLKIVNKHKVLSTQEQKKTAKTNRYSKLSGAAKVSKEGYIEFMSNIYLKTDGKQFKSTRPYVGCIDHALKTVRVDKEEFYSATRPLQHKRWRAKLVDKLSHVLRGRDERRKKYARNAIYAFDSFTNYVVCQKTLALMTHKNLITTEHLRQTA